MKNIFNFFLLFVSILYGYKKIQIIGGGSKSYGLGSIGVNLFESLIDDFDINYTLTSPFDASSLNKEVMEKISYSITNDLIEYDIAIYTDLISTIDDNNIIYSNINLLKKSKVKIAYSMLECSPIPKVWVEKLNNIFDYIIVPCEWVKETYLESGVTKPIIVVPLIVQEFKQQKINLKKDKFIFGCIGGFGEDKNLHKVAQAFAEKFGNNKNYELIIKISGMPETNNILYKKIINITKHINNIKLLWGILDREEFTKLMLSFDSFVLASKGEGFSLIPREAVSLGIPCILSYNSAHKELCDKKLALAIKSDIKCLSDYRCFGDFRGIKFDCEVSDIKKCMSKMYNNYEFYFNDLQKNKHNISYCYFEEVKPNLINFLKTLCDI